MINFTHPEKPKEDFEYLPWEESSQIPCDWFMDNAESFIVSMDLIMKNIAPYSFGSPPHESGIYFLFDKDDLIYIGESVSIHNRLIQHYKNKRFDSYSCMIGMPGLYRKEIEAFYIHKYEPVLNAKYDRLHKAYKDLIE